jgi:hypothetical protein
MSNIKDLIIKDYPGGGKLILRGDKQIVIKKETVDILGEKFSWHILRSDQDGYVTYGNRRMFVHRIVLEKYPALDQEAKEKFAGLYKRLVIAHLDDNPLNFNKDNLMYVPESLNRFLQKRTKVEEMKNSKGIIIGYRSEFKSIKTKTFKTKEEAMHAYDCVKMTHPDVPQCFQKIIFNYGLTKPDSFKEYYFSMECLLERAKLYQRSIKRKPKVKQNNIYLTFSTEKDLKNSDIEEALKEKIFSTIKNSGTMLDKNLDFIVYFKGVRGAQYIFLLEKECYEKYFLEKPSLNCNQKGYIICSSMRSTVHVVVMDRIGKGASDKLHVMHGLGGLLDNRKRLLRVGTVNENNRDVSHKIFKI